MNKIIPLYFFWLLNVTCLAQVKQATDYTCFVNTFIGTDGTGHTFPGPSMPFGMVQPGPDNRDFGWDYTSGYQYKDSRIMGFSQTRANGTGISELGDILLQPVTDERTDDFALSYRKETEKASPGYYTVELKNKVKTELTATERVAFHQYTYPDHKAKLLIDLQHGLRFLTDSLVLESNVQVENNSRLSGWCHTQNWVNRKYYFTIEFSLPFTSILELPKKAKENASRFLLGFMLKDKRLKVKIALSTVSVEGAKENLKTELSHWEFNTIVSLAKNKWNRYLSRIVIEAPVKQKTIFYSCLYRLLLQPSNICDTDGQYRGPDDKIHTAINKEYYSTLSLWDSYRAAHPLYTLLIPERVNGFVNTLVEHAKAAGFLPIWTIWGQDNYCMIGNHAIPVIADAYLKGFRGFDADEALQQMVRSSRENHINSNWTLLNQYGYYPFDSLDNEAVSRTLEHGVDDYCIALMAEKMGKKDIAAEFYIRSAYYKNLYDPSTRQMRGKDSRGNWRTPFNPLTATSPMNNPGDYTEANAWQYFWTPAQFDVKGLTALLGGKKQFTSQLDSFFNIKSLNPNKHLGQEAMIGQYAHGNEPSHHIAWLYALSDHPEKADQLISRICTSFYNNTPDGITGNDDCGQMSAWYIYATLGFYPVNPVNGIFVRSVPQCTEIVLHTPGFNPVIINRRGTPEQPEYWLNNTLMKERFIYFEQLLVVGQKTNN
ncbi:MAG TPA: GH92 family glycosyl hydrolase [Chitinophagaceae bacterium]|nr:GH92 family glycosyl hydrolase [Chitinophagaceae bacterium]